ncbi:MAG: flagellar basal body P-ring formation chaperone FlgA [Planctomycetota bacterium]
MKTLATLLTLALTAHMAAESIRLHDQAGTAGPAIKLMDIAELEGEYAQSLGDLIVGRFAEGQDQLTVQLATVRRVLTESQANWGSLSLRGKNSCAVFRSPSAGELQDVAVDNNRAVITNNELAIDQANAGQTVSGLLIQEIVELNQATPGELEITFRGNADEAAWLNRSVAVGRYEIESLSRSGLGRVPLKVRRYDAAGTVEEVTLTADVSRRVMAVVATQQIRRGELFNSKNIGLREVLITSDHGETLGSIDLLIGQSSASAIREGSLVLADHVAPDVLVKRGDLVTVACVSGSLVVRTVGRASEDGVLGDIVAVRHPETRETFYATVSGKRQATITTATPKQTLAQIEDRP